MEVHGLPVCVKSSASSVCTMGSFNRIKDHWLGAALLSAICSSLIIFTLPIKNARYYIPSSVVMSALLYGVIQGGLLFSSAP